jgi:hypothetical protein
LNGTDRYEGTFQQGKFHGSGLWMTSRNGGIRYDGDFAQGVFEGHGTLLEPGHMRYDGSFERGLRHGIGIMRTPGSFWGTNIVKHAWKEGKIMPEWRDLPHDEM